ncbi:MAG TPA: NusG domain II-containing protein [Thermodesulfovibrionales bacterium]|nr:NusG domain II-containing protein [Thermodesulfovibrionales bacterium]
MFLLLVSLLGIFLIKEVLPRSSEVTIEVAGKVEYRYPVDSDRTVRIESPYGHLTLEIKDRKVRVVGASCPSKHCEHQGWITGGAIICLPGRISVLVGSPEKSKGRAVDATTG